MINRFNKFTVLIAKINRIIHKIKDSEMKKLGLKSTHVSCLYYLYIEENGLTAAELCNICSEDKAAISRSIDYLEQNGYIYCDAKTKKRYKSPLFLTEKGKKIGERICDLVDKILDIASQEITEEKRSILYESLESIQNNLDKYIEKEKLN